MSGWIKIHRCITNHWIYTENRVYSKFEAWLDILLTVNFADAQVLIKGKLYNVKRGQSILSMDSWANRWNWDKSKVRRFFNLLQKDKMIEIKTDTITTQLTVCNYESYQDKRNADETQTKRKRHTDDTQTTPIEEEEENKEEKQEKEFQKFWSMYGKVGNRKTALTSFQNISKKDKEAILKHIPVYIKNHKDNDKVSFIPHFTTYLNQRRWEDDLPYKVIKNTFEFKNKATLDDD